MQPDSETGLKNETFRNLVELASDAYFVADVGGTYTYVNAAACEMYRYPREELVGKTIVDLIRPEDIPRLDDLRTRVLAGETEVAEWSMKRGDGTWFPAEVSTRMLPGGNWLAIVRDITERKKIEQALREAVRARDEFISTASHELRTPLTALHLRLETIRRRAQAGRLDREGLLQAVQVGERQVNRLTGVVERLLDSSELREGTLGYVFEETDLVAIVEGVLEELGVYLAETPVRKKLPERMAGRWDRFRLEQVVVNLLSNAVKYAPGAPISIEGTCREGQVRLVFEDEGPGMDAAVQERIFQRFERATDDKRGWGLGLGLFIAREIARGHGGELTVDSRPGHGARFILTLPLEPPPRT